MTTDRCPSCNAAVTASAQWCTLCYAVLRVPQTVPADDRADLSGPVAEAGAGPVAGAPLPPDPILDAPVFQAAPVAGAEPKGWPCLNCGVMVPMADDACPKCSRPFLSGEELPALALPVVGDLGRMDRGQRVLLALAAGGVLTALMVLLAFIGGSIL